MVFGFGFNKTKVLASAERSVKQGKLQNAIADYEKVLAEDPKDLTVMNTIGDLYSRVGNTEKATEFFRKIGDAYAGEGFTVRAIAMYKKLTKQNPGAHDAVLKLGDLYTQQGLYNDARAQFMQVAEHHVRNNEFSQAASVFQKTLELDPENTSLQTRLAELYVKISRPADARDLYFRNAEALRIRGALDLADDALGRVLDLDPNFGPAMLMRGQVKFDSGDPEAAAKILEQVPDIDSRPEGLRTLLKAQLALGNLPAAEPIARKVLQIFNDCSGITGYGEALISSGAYEKALDFLSEHAAVLLASDQPAFMQVLQTLTARVKSNPKALEQLSDIFQRAGNTGCKVEVTELLAHAYVQQGELVKARDLYQRLTHLEPENPQHAQNFKQIIAKLSESLPPRRPAQVEQEPEPEPELESTSNTFSTEEIYPVSAVEQKYPGDLAELIEAALTDAELFDSYNLASKAIAPLEILLPRVPNDVRMNQRLASLYARAGRLQEAAERCSALEKVHVQAGFLKDSRYYADLAAKYRQRAGVSVESATAPATTKPVPLAPLADVSAHPIAPPAAPQTPAPQFVPAVAPAPVAVPAPPQSHEMDFSAEWEQMLEVEHPEPPPAPVPPPPPVVSRPPVPPVAQPVSAWESANEEETDLIAELLDEVRFYISQAMQPEARAALARCELLAPGNSEVATLKAQLAEVDSALPTAESSVGEFEFVSSENELQDQAADATDPLLVPAFEPTSSPAVSEHPAPELLPLHPALEQPEELEPEPFVAQTVAEPPAPIAPPVIEPPADLHPAIYYEEPAHEEPVREEPREEPVDEQPVPIHAAAATHPIERLDDFVHDLDLSLGDDFKIAPVSKVPESPSAPIVAAEPVVAPPPIQPLPSVAISQPVAPAPIAAAPIVPAPVVAPAAIAPELSAPQPIAAVPEITADEERNALNDIFAEFKESMETDADKQEDPETHYNLGVAFKEMDLFDEAIGEFQKVCKAIEQGVPFSQPVQAYTWLADCFLKKEVPDLAIRWYERALKSSTIDYETDTAIRYELACACIAAGDQPAALKHFMEVYGTNIDYRDVAERIKTLRS
jgi:tetratricopeptide (TPR) repeat protein